MQTVGIIHPGSMGAAVASCAAENTARVLWCSAGRSAATVARAQRYGLEPVATLRELANRVSVLISLCPPAVAESVASEVAALDFRGLYVEGNAISPERVQRIGIAMPSASIIDAAVVGSPPTDGKATRLYLSGPPEMTDRIEALFVGTAVEVRVLGSEIGQASALKLAYSSFQKASRTLAALAVGVAREHGVDEELADIASTRRRSYLAEPEYIPKTAARAWRWAPELDDAADMTAAAGLPDDMLRAAARTLDRWQDSKDDAELSLAEALACLTRR